MKTKRYITSDEVKAFKKFLIDSDIDMSGFANRIGVSKQYISRIVHGETPITEKVIFMFGVAGFHFDK